MFVTVPDYEFHVPPQLAPPGAKFWRALGISVHAAWFVLTVRPKVPDALLDTFFLTWDTDVVDAVASLDAEVRSLICVAPRVNDGAGVWRATQIREIWEGTHPASDGRSILFVGEDGRDYAGLFFEPVVKAVRSQLVARVGSAKEANARGACH